LAHLPPPPQGWEDYASKPHFSQVLILIDGLTLLKQELPLREMVPVLITGVME